MILSCEKEADKSDTEEKEEILLSLMWFCLNEKKGSSWLGFQFSYSESKWGHFDFNISLFFHELLINARSSHWSKINFLISF